MTDAPAWAKASEVELEGLSDEQVEEYVRYWRASADAYRRARRRLPKDDPEAFRTGWSCWWCGKYASKGVREQQRRKESAHD